jgi:hypothetical protein
MTPSATLRVVFATVPVLLASTASAQTARVINIIQGSAAISNYDPLDLYVNGASTPTATIEYPNGTPDEIVVPANQTLTVRAVLQNPPPGLPNEATVSGTVPEGCFKVTLAGIPAQVLFLFASNPEGVNRALRAIFAPIPCTLRSVDVGLVVANAVTDSPSIRVLERASGQVVAAGVAFGEASPPVALPAGAYTFDVYRASDNTLVRSFTLDLNDEAGQTVQLTYTGFVNPAANQNGPPVTIVGVDASGQGETGSPVAGESGPPADRVSVGVPQPNPAHGRTAVAFTTVEAADVRVSVVDVLGREVAVLAVGPVGPGAHTADFDASRLAPGAYVVRLVAGAEVQTSRLTVVR